MKAKKYSFFLCFISTIIAHNSTTVHHYLWANYNHFSGKKNQANKWYKKIFSTKHSPYTYKGYLSHLYDMQKFNTIISLMPSLNKKFENDLEIQLIFANALEKTNKQQESHDYIIKLSQNFKNSSEVSLRAAHIYMSRKEPENALSIIDYFLNNTPRRPNNFVFYYLKTQIYLQLSQFNDALTTINSCLELHPHFDKGWLLYASLSEKEGNIKNALKGYANFLEIAPHNPMIKKHLSTLTVKYNATKQNKNE